MSSRKKNESDMSDAEIAAIVRRDLKDWEAMIGHEEKRLAKGKSKASRSKRSGMTFAQAMMRYLQDDLAGAVKIMRKAVQRADESMPENEPERFRMHAVLADWLSELGGPLELEEARQQIEIAWAFVTVHPIGKVYLAEVTERKTKVEERMK
jgi:hypothetical protein